MNKHILLVMKWLNDKSSVTQEELESSSISAVAAYAAAAAAAHADAVADAVAAAAAAAHADAVADAVAAEKWVGKYFERSGEDRQQYVDALTPVRVSPTNGQKLTVGDTEVTFIGLAPSGRWVCQHTGGSCLPYRPAECKPIVSTEDELVNVIASDSGLELTIATSRAIAAVVAAAGYHL